MLVLVDHPVPDRAQVVAEVGLTGGLDAREHDASWPGRVAGARAATSRWRNSGAASLAAMAYEVPTPVFEGPFDLLLHLILREQVDLYEVSLGAIVDAYLAELERIGSRASTSTSPPSSCSSPPRWSS